MGKRKNYRKDKQGIVTVTGNNESEYFWSDDYDPPVRFSTHELAMCHRASVIQDRMRIKCPDCGCKLYDDHGRLITERRANELHIS